MANDVHQLTIVGNLGGQFVENVQFFQTDIASSTDPQLDSEDLITQWQSNLESAYLDCCPADYEIHGYKARRVNNGGGPTMVLPITPAPGTRTGVLIEQAGGPCLISAYAHAGAFKAGRWFVPGITSLDCVNGVIQTGLATVVDTFLGLIQGTFNGGPHEWQFVVWSRKFTIATIPILVSLSLKVGIQKRRLQPVM